MFIYRAALKRFLKSLFGLSSKKSYGTPYFSSDPYAEVKRQQAERISRNARPYLLEEIPFDMKQLSLVDYSFSYRDETYDMVYLMKGYIPIPNFSDRTAVFSRFWDGHGAAIWAWRGDNLTDRLRDEDLWRLASERFQTMLNLLESAGWKVVEKNKPDPNFVVYFLERGG